MKRHAKQYTNTVSLCLRRDVPRSRHMDFVFTRTKQSKNTYAVRHYLYWSGYAILCYSNYVYAEIRHYYTHTQLATVRLHVLTKTIWSPVRASQDLKRGNAAWPRHHWPIVSHTIQCSSNRNNAWYMYKRNYQQMTPAARDQVQDREKDQSVQHVPFGLLCKKWDNRTGLQVKLSKLCNQLDYSGNAQADRATLPANA